MFNPVDRPLMQPYAGVQPGRAADDPDREPGREVSRRQDRRRRVGGDRKRAEAAARERSERRRRSVLQRAAECSAPGSKSARPSPGETRLPAGRALAFAAWASAALGAQEASPPAAVDRVRARLEKPPSKLTLQPRRPTSQCTSRNGVRCRTSSMSRRGQPTPIGWQPPRDRLRFVSVRPLLDR